MLVLLNIILSYFPGFIGVVPVHVPAEIAKPSSGVNNMDTPRIRERDLKTGGVAAELLEAGVTDWDGTAGTVKF